MSIKLNNKVYRNTQEQVLKNAEDIEELKAGTILIPDGAVTAPKIAGEAVTTEKLAPNAISTSKIQAGAVTTTKLDSQAVTTAKIADEAVTTAKIADNSVTDEKISTIDITKIVDSNNKQRFIEGVNTIPSDFTDYATITYNKWSLSGTHLMIVVAGYLNAGISAYTGDFIAINTNLPSWILEKITGGNYGIIDYKDYEALNSSFQKIAIEGYWQKSGDLVYRATTIGGTTSDATFRIQFDLLIDNE